MRQRLGFLLPTLYGKAVLWTVAAENYWDREDTPEIQAVWEEFTHCREMDHLDPENPG